MTAEEQTKTERGMRKEFVGVVMSNKMNKTIIVETSRRVSHEKYTKTITLRAKFYAHDAKEQANMGDTVRIRETRPMSKTKRWTLVEVVRKGDESNMPAARGRIRKTKASSSVATPSKAAVTKAAAAKGGAK